MIRSDELSPVRNSSMDTNYPDSSSGRMIRLFDRIYTQTIYQTNYRSLPKFVPDGWFVSSINRAIVAKSVRDLSPEMRQKFEFEAVPRE